MAVESRLPDLLAGPFRPPVTTKSRVERRSPNRRSTANLVRCEALNYTLGRLHEETVVIVRQTVVESNTPSRLSNQNVIEMDYKP